MICTKYLVSETQIDYSKWNMCNAFGSHIYRDKMEFKNRYERRLSVELEIKDETKRRKAYHLSYGLWWHSLTRQPCMHTIDWRLCAPGCRKSNGFLSSLAPVVSRYSNNKVDHCASQILRGMKPLLGITSASTSSLSNRGHFKGYCAPQLAIS